MGPGITQILVCNPYQISTLHFELAYLQGYYLFNLTVFHCIILVGDPLGLFYHKIILI